MTSLSSRLRIFMSACAALTLSACAGPITATPQASQADILREQQFQQNLVFERVVEDQRKLFDLSYPILKANAEFCRPKTAPMMGMTAWNLASLSNRQWQAAAQNIYGLTNRLTVRSVAKNSPAAKAGLRSGDIIVAINGATLPQGANALKTADTIVKQSGMNPLDIVYERGGRAVSTVLQPVEGCDYPVVLDSNSNDINAYADGKRIVVSKGIMRFAENDNEMALVIAHELGHSAMRHIDKIRQNATVGTLGGLAVDSLLAAAGINTGGQIAGLGQQAAIMQYSVPFEQEADYVGMYFMERAGYSAASVGQFWRRMGAENAQSITRRSTHPTSVERFLAIERTYAEIQNKKKRGQPLVPNVQQKR